jgi:hypothetical protein
VSPARIDDHQEARLAWQQALDIIKRNSARDTHGIRAKLTRLDTSR